MTAVDGVSDIESLRTWSDHAIERLRRSGSARTQALYGPAGKVGHFRRLSERLFRQFHDIPLAQAALLHGVDPADQSELEHWTDISAMVREILHDRARLRSIGGWGERNESFLTHKDGPELARLLVGNVLPLIRSARSLVLFIAEQLEELDDSQVLSDWTLAFPRNPAPLSDGFRLATPRDRFSTVEARAAFLKWVVATTAAHFGLWQERNIAENLALFHERPDRFRKVLDLVLADVEHVGQAAALVEMVRSAVGEQWQLHVHWEWHHLAGIERSIGRDLVEDTWIKRFDRTGFVAISCSTPSDCYQVLENLHATLEYIPSETRDKIGRPQPSGYRALHTTLVRRGERQELVPVHIVLEEAGSSRFELITLERLEFIAKRMRSDEKPTIRVFAPDGRAHDMAPGSLVMNFAAAVHTELLTRLRGATVNRRYVRPNFMLHDGDVVWLDLADTPQHLPDEWFEQVPESTRAHLRKHYVDGFKPTLLAAGRRWLRARVEAAGFRGTLDDKEMERMLEDVNLIALNPNIRGTRSLLRQIGLLDARERGNDLVRDLLVDRAAADQIAEALIARLRTIRLASEIDVPTDLRAKAARFEACAQCVPQADEDLAARLVDGDVLVIHRALASCAHGATPIERVRRVAELQSFLIETTNRVGVAAEVLEVFQRHEVDVEEVAARRIGVGWGVVRVTADFLSKARQAAVVDDLAAIAGVGRIIKPGDEPVPALENALPPRSPESRPLWARAAPYQLGPAIDDDRLFYGMDRQLDTLEQTYMRMTEAHVTALGQLAFISGPLRSGKSSLARKFLRLHEHDRVRPVIVYDVAARDPWSVVSPTFARKLLAVHSDAAAPVAEDATLEEAIAAVRATTTAPIVLVLDEAVSVFSASNQSEDEVMAMERFYRFISATERVLAVLIGPDAPIRKLEPRLINILQAGVRVGVTRLHTDAIRDLLTAEKYRPAYAIEVEPGVVEVTESLTAGNPYWISLLAAKMYYDGSSKSRETVFTQAGLDMARKELLEETIPFASRLPQTEVETRVVQVLLKHLSPEKRSVPFSLIAEAIDAPAAAIDEALTDLTLAGTLVKRDRRYRIAAPLLQQFLAAHYGGAR